MLRSISFIAIVFLLMGLSSKEYEPLLYPGIVNKVYERTGSKLLWLSSENKRNELVTLIDSFAAKHLIGQAYHSRWMHEQTDTSLAADKVYTDAAISAMKDLHEGYKISSRIFFDPISPTYTGSDNDFIV